MRDRARVGAEPDEQRLDAGECGDQRRGQHQGEPHALSEATADLLVAAAAVGVGDDGRDGHQDTEAQQPEHLVVAAPDGDAGERLYRRLGWTVVGTIPRFALDTDGRTLHDTVVFYKELAASP